MLLLSLLLTVAIVGAIVIACRPLPEPPRHRAADAGDADVVRAPTSVPGARRG